LRITTRAPGDSLSLTVMTLTIPITGAHCARFAMIGTRLRHRLLDGQSDAAPAWPARARAKFFYFFCEANRKKIWENFGIFRKVDLQILTT